MSPFVVCLELDGKDLAKDSAHKQAALNAEKSLIDQHFGSTSASFWARDARKMNYQYKL